MYEEYKELERLWKLHSAYEQQKKRLIELLEIDAKRIGVVRLAENFGIKHSYIYTIFKKQSISYNQLLDFYLKVQEIKRILGIDNVRLAGDKNEKSNN